jgi:hypothetical protein
MSLVTDDMFRLSPNFFNGLFNLLLDVIPFKATTGFHADNSNVFMLMYCESAFSLLVQKPYFWGAIT